MEPSTDKRLELYMNMITRQILALGEQSRPHDVLMTVSVGLRGLGNPHKLRGEIIIGFTPIQGQVDVVQRRLVDREAEPLEGSTPE